MKELTTTRHSSVHFSEVDSLGIVWHGNYVKYFEDAREQFGEEYGLGYLNMYSNGFVAPVVKFEVEYKKPLAFGEAFDVEIRYVPCMSAKLIFTYVLRKSATGEIAATGTSVQAFVDLSYNLLLYAPDYVEQWREQHGVKM